MINYSPHINVMIKAARKASRVLIRDFGELENLQVSKKGTRGFVSVSDVKAEKIIFEELAKARPDYGFLLEESGYIKGKDSKFCWIVDPLDGTNNFIHGYHEFAISIALEETLADGTKQIIAGMVDMPFAKQCFWAEKGKGAWLEKFDSAKLERLRVSSRSKLSDAIICVGVINRDYKYIQAIQDDVCALRCIGSSTIAMAMVAAGKFDAFINESTLKWDVAAGTILISEAGGTISYLNQKDIIASNENIHKNILKKL